MLNDDASLKNAVDRFWDRFIEHTRKAGVKESALRWHVRRAEAYLKAFPDKRLAEHSVDQLMANHPKGLAVLNAVAERAGWGEPAAEGVHRGLAVCKAFASHVAACAEVSVDAKERVV